MTMTGMQWQFMGTEMYWLLLEFPCYSIRLELNNDVHEFLIYKYQCMDAHTGKGSRF